MGQFSSYSTATSFTTLVSPATPTITYPTEGLTGVDKNPTITSSAFSSVEGDTHASSTWQIATDSGFSSVVWSKSADSTNKTSITVNTTNGTFAGALAGETSLGYSTEYYVRVKYTDSGGFDSAYSTGVSFTVRAPTTIWNSEMVKEFPKGIVDCAKPGMMTTDEETPTREPNDGAVTLDLSTDRLYWRSNSEWLYTTSLSQSITIGDGTADTDYSLTFNGETNDGVLTWMEDEDYFQFSDDILLPDNEALKLGTGVDATLLYNGTNLLLNPKAVGSGYLNVQGQLLLDDKLSLTQTDGNEYIDSLADGYVDISATTAIRLRNSTADTDVPLHFVGTTNSGVYTWMEDEDYLSASDGILMSTTEEIFFRDTAIHIKSADDGHLDLTADISIDINGTLALGANNITMTGSLAATGARVTKGWFTDIESTNMPTVGGVSLTTTFVNVTGDTMTGELNIDSDTNGIVWGDGQDAKIYYDGTNFLLNPKVVGSGYLNINGVTLLDDKLAFTQTDLNEYIDSLNDGYIDIGATTGIRLLQDTFITSDSDKLHVGAGNDMGIYYDGTNGNIDTDLVAASDLTIDCGTAKTLVLEVPVYQDCNIGGLVLRTGGTAPGVVQILDNDGDNTGIYTVGFAVNEEGSAVVEIPHDYKEGTDLVFHVHWGANDAPTDTDYVAWQLTYSISRDNNTFPDSITPAKAETAYDTQYEWLRTDVATITGSTGGVDGGNIKIGDQFHFSIKRVLADGAAYGGEVLVASIGFHYQIDTLGSRQIGTK